MIDFLINNMVYGRNSYSRSDFSRRNSQTRYTSFTSNQETKDEDKLKDVTLTDIIIGMGTLLVGGAVYLLSKGKKGRNFLNKVSELMGNKVKPVEPKVNSKQVNSVIEEIPDDIVEELVDGKWVPYYRNRK